MTMIINPQFYRAKRKRERERQVCSSVLCCCIQHIKRRTGERKADLSYGGKMDGRMMGRGAPNRHVLLPLMRNIERKGEDWDWRLFLLLLVMMLTGIDGAAGGTTTITKDGGFLLFSSPSPHFFLFFPPFFPPVDELCVLETSDCKSARDRVWQRDERKRNIFCRPEMMQLERWVQGVSVCHRVLGRDDDGQEMTSSCQTSSCQSERRQRHQPKQLTGVLWFDVDRYDLIDPSATPFRRRSEATKKAQDNKIK